MGSGLQQPTRVDLARFADLEQQCVVGVDLLALREFYLEQFSLSRADVKTGLWIGAFDRFARARVNELADHQAGERAMIVVPSAPIAKRISALCLGLFFLLRALRLDWEVV
eukprot:CAMPEP_0170196516 /NCGR_PEP_ID=MMETSP0040_2-20121228/64127_1 /TAXON_ID=641309 /ORGANISM="Lotharella oceanica, Strain CCMP622" /LENGTH=110 /DNA_ID=CAMNT_0010445947 /DNA_START=413 /DNA_END=748 /DNA_ORIENTATION=+